MDCSLCKAKILPGVTNYVNSFGDCIIIIKNTPCLKCNQCGERSFTLDMAKKLEVIVDKLEALSPEIGVYEYSKVVSLCEEQTKLQQNIL